MVQSDLALRRISALACVVFSGAIMPQAFAQSTAQTPNTSQSAPASAQQPLPAQNTLALAVENVGITRCKEALVRLSDLAAKDTVGNDVLLDWDRNRVQNTPVFATIGLEYPNGGAALSINAVPESDGSCSVAAERISFAPVSCAQIAQQELAGQQKTQLLNRFAVYSDPADSTATVSLIDTPPGCLVIRRYVEFNWRAPQVK